MSVIIAQKKPLRVTAMQFDGTYPSGLAICKWMKQGLTMDGIDPTKLLVHTLEGPVWACEGDYVVCGVAGEFYPVAEAIFKASYDVIGEEEA